MELVAESQENGYLRRYPHMTNRAWGLQAMFCLLFWVQDVQCVHAAKAHLGVSSCIRFCMCRIHFFCMKVGLGV